MASHIKLLLFLIHNGITINDGGIINSKEIGFTITNNTANKYDLNNNHKRL